MNGYELADKLEKAFMTNTSQYYAMPAVELLRQQNYEIETLRIQLQIVSKNLHMGISKSIQKAQAKAIDEVLNESR